MAIDLLAQQTSQQQSGPVDLLAPAPGAIPGKLDLRAQGEQMKQDVKNISDFAQTGLLKSATGKGFQDREMAAMTPEPKVADSRPYDANITAAENPIARVAQIGAATAAGIQGQQADNLMSPLGLVASATEPVVNTAKDMASNASARMNDWLVKLPNKAFNYSKDPLSILNQEKVTGNSISGLASAYEDRLAQRNQELSQALQDSKSKVSIGNAVDAHIEDAGGKLTNSLRDRTSDTNALGLMKQRLTQQYGDLNSLSVQDAVKLKRQLAVDYPFTKENSTDVVANAAHKIYHTIDSAVDIAEPKIADLNQRVSGLIDISRAAKNRAIIESRQNPIGFIGGLLGYGAAGTVAGHGLEGGAIGLTAALGAKALSSPAVISRVAKGLAMLGEGDKIQLYKAEPEFMNFVEQAEKQSAWKMAMAGSTGETPISQGGEKEAELVGGQRITQQKPILRADRVLPSPQKAGQSSGPVINQQGPTGGEGPNQFLDEAKQNMKGNLGGAAIGLGAGVAASSQNAEARQIPPDKSAIIEKVAKSYGLNREQTNLLKAIRLAENGGPGKEFGVLTPQAMRFKNNPEKSFEIQAKWAAGSIRNHYDGDIDRFAHRWAPLKANNDPHHLNANWAKNVKFYMKQLQGGN